MDIAQLTTFFGWCTIINLAILTFLAAYIMLMRNIAAKIHAKMFGVAEEDLPRIYFKYIAYTQLVMVPTSLVPWLALKMM